MQVIGVTGRIEGEVIETVSLWERRDGRPLRWTGQQPPRREKFDEADVDLEELLR